MSARATSSPRTGLVGSSGDLLKTVAGCANDLAVQPVFYSREFFGPTVALQLGPNVGGVIEATKTVRIQQLSDPP